MAADLGQSFSKSCTHVTCDAEVLEIDHPCEGYHPLLTVGQDQPSVTVPLRLVIAVDLS